jgi:hypothetical protein
MHSQYHNGWVIYRKVAKGNMYFIDKFPTWRWGESIATVYATRAEALFVAQNTLDLDIYTIA